MPLTEPYTYTLPETSNVPTALSTISETRTGLLHTIASPSIEESLLSRTSEIVGLSSESNNTKPLLSTEAASRLSVFEEISKGILVQLWIVISLSVVVSAFEATLRSSYAFAPPRNSKDSILGTFSVNTVPSIIDEISRTIFCAPEFTAESTRFCVILHAAASNSVALASLFKEGF